MLPVGKNTLLHPVRRRSMPDTVASAVIGINECPWRRRPLRDVLVRQRVLGPFPDGMLLP